MGKFTLYTLPYLSSLRLKIYGDDDAVNSNEVGFILNPTFVFGIENIEALRYKFFCSLVESLGFNVLNV